MDLGPGQRAKLLNIIDGSRADAMEFEPLYTIEVTVSKSPGGVKCGAITMFKSNPVQFDYERLLSNDKMSPDDTRRALAEANELSKEAATKTETMSMDPIYFKLAAPDNRWLPWALSKALELYDQVGGSARILVKAPRLKIRLACSPKTIAMKRGNLDELFPIVRDIDELFDRGFQFDPWKKNVHRGLIGPKL